MQKPIDAVRRRIYLENPVELDLNAAKNVSEPSLRTFVSCCEKSRALVLSLNRAKQPGSLSYLVSDLLNEIMKDKAFNSKKFKSQEAYLQIADEMNTDIK